MPFAKLERIWLKSNASYSEKFVQDRIADDPSILGLGELVLKDRERVQPTAGRLDLLLQDPDSGRRYETEIQLGSTDESHIIRTIEYWDIERKLYPQYDHCAVLIAEDITSRFLNVIGLFNGSIPLIAVQMKALRFGDAVALDFTTVMGEFKRGFEEDEEEAEPTDRAYWETKKGTPQIVALADKLLEMIHTFAPGLELKYNKFYIGLARDGQPNNFVIFRARRSYLRAELRLPQSDEIQSQLEDAELEVMDYDKRWDRYRIRLTASDIKARGQLLTDLMKQACERAGT